MKNIKKILYSLALCGALNSGPLLQAGISYVYNLPLDRSTFPIKNRSEDKRHFFSILATDFAAITIIEHNSIALGGALLKACYNFDDFWVQLKLGSVIGLSHAELHGLDDIVLSTGYDFHIGEKSGLSLSILAGFPTTSSDIFSPVGTGHYSIGANIDSLICYCSGKSSDHAIIAQAQFVHYFPSTHSFAKQLESNWLSRLAGTPSLITGEAKINMGNQLDFIIGNHSHWGNYHLELGYNPTIRFVPNIIEGNIETNSAWLKKQEFKVPIGTFCSHTVYADYNYLFAINNRVGASIGLGIAYSLTPAKEQLYNNNIHSVDLYLNAGFTF